MSGLSRKRVYEVLDLERDYQDWKWGPIETRHQQVGSFLTVMRHILTNAEKDFAENNGDVQALNQMRKLVAVGVACFEKHGVPDRIDTFKRIPSPVKTHE